MYDESNMASSTWQETREFYYKKQVFGHFRQFNSCCLTELFVKIDHYCRGFERKMKRGLDSYKIIVR